VEIQGGDVPGNRELAPEQLYHGCDEAALSFHTTAELQDLQDILGQERAVEALNFGVGVGHEGYNLYVMGSPGLGKHTVARRVLEAQAKQRPPLYDWCYIHNFQQPHKPHMLRLPAGRGVPLQQEMRTLVHDLLAQLPSAFDSDEYRAKMQAIHDEYKARETKGFDELTESARKKDILLVRTPIGYTLAPTQKGEVIGPQEFNALPEKVRHQMERGSEDIRSGLRQFIQQVADWQKEHDKRVEEVNRQTAKSVVERRILQTRSVYRDLPDVLAFLDQVGGNIIESADELRQFATENKTMPDSARFSPFNRYYVNVLVDNGGGQGAPVIYEDNPTYQNLNGRIEHLAQFGTLLTDFTLIKGGALHRANGGYLILDAIKVLSYPFAWDALKRALRGQEIRIQSLEQMLSLVSTTSLEPEPMPLDVKVVLTGERLLYYLLCHYDPEFALLFKVEADFAEDMPRTADNTQLYARLIATLQRREKLCPMDRGAVARLIEDAARTADDSEKLSLHMGGLLDMLRESDYVARQAGSDVVRADHVDQAIDARRRRAGQIRERINESILRGIRLIDTAGERVAQVNGLAVTQLGNYAFGFPSRITATARLGDGKLIDIEREVELGGPTHSKGVLILSSYLANRYAQDQPLSMAGSVVFEQSYGPVEGDSASLAELCALLSALSGLPLRQDIALTGSVNQAGQVQAIGGVNEKIEGFFDICQARGLGGTQGVIIPAANVKHLMLRKDVVAAARAGKYRVHAVEQVDQAMEILTGREAGAVDATGNFAAESINGRVQARLRELTGLRLKFARSAREDRNGD
jgi:lon-related putative ATP-dependent protease